MNEHSLSRLYRRQTSVQPCATIAAGELVDAVAHAAGSGVAVSANHDAVVAALALSPAHADLARLLRALEAPSRELARDVDSVLGVVQPLRRSVPQTATATHGAAGALRWASGIAASLALVFGAWVWHGEQQAHRWNDVAATTITAARPDRIFTSQDRIFASSSAIPARSERGADRLFRADFSKGG